MEDVQEVNILNMIVIWAESWVELEADPRHAELVVRELGLENATPIACPGAKPATGEEGAEDNIEMSREDARRYRAIAARLNYLAPDRTDIGYALKEAARNMASPMQGDWIKLKRIGDT